MNHPIVDGSPTHNSDGTVDPRDAQRHQSREYRRAELHERHGTDAEHLAGEQLVRPHM